MKTVVTLSTPEAVFKELSAKRAGTIEASPAQAMGLLVGANVRIQPEVMNSLSFMTMQVTALEAGREGNILVRVNIPGRAPGW
jgi:hypothetical protein